MSLLSVFYRWLQPYRLSASCQRPLTCEGSHARMISLRVEVSRV
ncbi:hypothetical protein ABWL39_20740 [Chitinivorax sp. PXF-14]